jgi:acyl-CoA dehydrogenase
MIPRTLFEPEHEQFRRAFGTFLDREIVPHHAAWEDAGVVDRSAWTAAGAQGFLCMTMPEAYGGQDADRLFPIVLVEELAKRNLSGPFFHLHSDVVAPYLLAYGDEPMKAAWLPRMARGEAIGAIAMTEPDGGSDLQAMRTSARRVGDDYVIHGQKTFISNGQLADLVIVAAKTDPLAGGHGISLFLVEGDREGLRRGRNLKKMGGHAQDTSELFFDEVRVPASNRLGAEGRGFAMLMRELAWERMIIAARAVSTAESALAWTVAYARDRRLFGGALLDMQYIRFKLAEHKAQVAMARVFVDRCLELVVAGDLDNAVAAVAKLQTTELLGRLLDDCVQFHGGHGYMWEQPICRAFVDARQSRIAGGSNEVMRELVARTLV